MYKYLTAKNHNLCNSVS